jgi:asparagine synthase (glutamine-hydrolysing)
MTSIIGWSGATAPPDADALVARMSAATGDTAPPLAVHRLRADISAGAFHADGALVVAVAGRPRWKDATRAEFAARHGIAASVADAFRTLGEKLLERLGGHFALALLDKQRGTTLLAIDRIGAFPMCYAVAGDQLVFASSADAVRAHGAVDDRLSPQALYDFLYFHMIPSPGTVYENIRKLEPAQAVVFENGTLRHSFYWTPQFVDGGPASFAELQDEFLRIVRESVKRCDPDDTTGAFLSGGTDSSTVSGMLAGVRGHARTYSIGFSQQGYDEISYARIAAQHFKTDQHEYYVTADDVADAFGQVAAFYDEPFGNSSAIPTLFCARLAARDGIRVMLAGDGGDELFGGNARYAKQKVFNVYNALPGALRTAVLEPLFVGLPVAKWVPPLRKVRSYIEQARQPMPDRMESYNFLHRDDPNRIFAPEFRTRFSTEHPLVLLRDVYNRASTRSLLNHMLYLDWKITLADNDLRKVNRMCALGGVEVRYPMLDDELLEFSARVPPSMKLKGLKLRWFFKKSLENFLPAEIITKPKHGFGLPFGEWLKESPRLQDAVYSSLHDFKSRKLLKAEFIDDLIATHRGGHAAYYGTMIWVIAMLELWLRAHRAS